MKVLTIITIIIIIITAIGLSPGGSGYFTCIQNLKLFTNKFKSGGLHEKHVMATWNVGNRLSAFYCIYIHTYIYTYICIIRIQANVEIVIHIYIYIFIHIFQVVTT